jgi:hypothetical protein
MGIKHSDNKVPSQGPCTALRGDRDNANKAPVSMVLEAPHAIEAIARVLQFGANKYARSNWKKGLPVTEIIDSMLRHQLAYLNGETIDPESGLRHTDHIACNALFLAEMAITREDMDDRSIMACRELLPGEKA